MLETSRLLLRQWREADREPWVAMCADPDVMRTLGGVVERERALADAEMLQARLERDGYGWWVVEVDDVTPFAGLIALQDVPFEAAFTPALEVCWRLRRDCWGKGFATEGAAVALDFAFFGLDKDEVVASTAVVNAPSQRVMERLGMRRDLSGDFEHPSLGGVLGPHALYRKKRTAASPVGVSDGSSSTRVPRRVDVS